MADSKENIKGSLDLQEGEISNSGGFQNVLNFRDVGRTVNDFTGEQYCPPSSLKHYEQAMQNVYWLTKTQAGKGRHPFSISQTG
jgi:hypothetical protein